jgi:hypothetical protein
MKKNCGSKKEMKMKDGGPVWSKPMPKNKMKGKLTSAEKSRAKARAKAAGRPYPSMVDNLNARKK